MIIQTILTQGKTLEIASKALILLHGRGGTAQNILGLANEFCDDRFFIAAPQALNNIWYPQTFMADETANEPWLSSSIEEIKKLIDDIAKVIPLEQIYLMGFSQGACISLELSARFAAKYGGIVAFTGGLIGKTINERKYHGNFEGTKVFIGTSENDPHIPLERAIESREIMEKMGADATLLSYAGSTHIVIEAEIKWVREHIFNRKQK